MSYDSIYTKSNSLTSDLKIEIKRINSSGVYEATWRSLETLIADQVIVHNSIPSMSYKLANESFSFGVLRVPDCTLKLLSINGEFDKENNYNSIFFGFVRHKTLVKISHGYKDHSNDTFEYLEVYRGFLNEKSNNTKVSNSNTYQDLFIEDILTFLLKEYTYSSFTIISSTLNDLIYELFNRSEFTDFLTIDAFNISAGYNIQLIDFTDVEGQTQWLNILQNLSIGHSYLYQKNSEIYYQPISEQTTTVKLFDKDKIIKLEESSSGVDEVFEELYWKNTAISFIAPDNVYNRSKTFGIETITDPTDQANILANIGTRTAIARKKLKVKVVLYVNLSILQKIKVNAGDYELDDGLIWDQGNWDEENWGANLGASFTESSSFFMIREMKHNFQSGTTELIIEEI